MLKLTILRPCPRGKINAAKILLIMKGIFLLLILPTLLLSCTVPRVKHPESGNKDKIKIARLLDQAGQIQDPGQKITFISAAFLGTPYLANTLIGSSTTQEVFVLQLDGVDCFTLLDYVEALRRSSSFDEFKETLRHLRYRRGQVDFLARNHFFSEWGNSDFSQLQDVTSLVGGINVLRVKKTLNQKNDTTLFLPGYPVKKREIAFIPAEAIDKSLLSRLRSGDYIGIYSSAPGLDVTHTGIIVKTEEKIMFRHASSKDLFKKVVDEDFASYLGGEKGIIVYRAINKSQEKEGR